MPLNIPRVCTNLVADRDYRYEVTPGLFAEVMNSDE